MNVSGHVSSSQAYQIYLYRQALHPETFALRARRSIKHNAYELELWLTPGGHVARFSHAGFCCCELVTDLEDRLPMEGAVTGFACAGEHEFEHRFATERMTYITSVQTENLSDNLYRATLDEMTDFAKETGALAFAWNDTIPPASDRYTDQYSARTISAYGSSSPSSNGDGNGRAAHGIAANGFGLNGTANNGHANNGHASNGHAHNGHAGNGFGSNGHAITSVKHRAARPTSNLSLLDIQRLKKEVHCHSYHLIASQGLVLRTQTIFEHA